MKKYLLPATILLTAFSCKDKPHETATAKPKKHGLVIGNPIDIGIENTLIFPVGCDYSPEVIDPPKGKDGKIGTTDANCTTALTMCWNSSGNLNDRYANQEYVNASTQLFDITNILFYDMISGKTYPLVSDTFHILSFALHKEYEQPKIFYRVVQKDFNRDSVYDSADPVILFISDLSGKNMTQVTPDSEQFVDYFYYPKTQSILVKTLVDANKDHHFTPDDETNFRSISMKTPVMGSEIFSRSLRDSLRVN